MSIREHIQGAALGAEVFLYEIDLTVFDQGILYLTPTTDGAGSAVSFGGQVYAPHPIKAEGYEISDSGPMPRPKITVANLDNSLTALVEQNDDLQGGIVRRIRTYERYLDSGADPDGNAHKPIDEHIISQKVADDGEVIAWELAALMDLEGVKLPRRKIVRDFCDLEYRRWDGAAFDYTQATCPYVGAQSYDENGDPVADANDRCSKRLGTGCQARFGENGILPFGGFPGVARIRAR